MTSPPRTIPLSFGEHRLEVEIADTPALLARGLMFRRHLPEDRGMLFVLGRSEVACFWMRHTLVPLSVAFLDRERRVLNVEDMEPLDERGHLSAGPALYAVEANRGWFAGRGIGRGDGCSFDLPPPTSGA